MESDGEGKRSRSRTRSNSLSDDLRGLGESDDENDRLSESLSPRHLLVILRRREYTSGGTQTSSVDPRWKCKS